MYISTKKYNTVINNKDLEIRKLENKLIETNLKLKNIESEYNYLKINNRESINRISKLEDELTILKKIEHSYIIITNDNKVQKIKGYSITSDNNGSNLCITIYDKNYNTIVHITDVKQYTVN